MSIIKKSKDLILKCFCGELIPRSLLDLSEYFRNYGSINFEYKKSDNSIVAISTNFKFGSIVTSGKNYKELDKKIKDAILTSFEVPSSYAQEAKIQRTDETQKQYALA
ncbi:MAG: hypothetical protein WC768_03005 [Patescibacteria group bacterium]|jgi:hypothetical protein